MKLNSSNSPIYLPDKLQTTVLRLGLENRPYDDWIFPPSDLDCFLRHKVEMDILHSDECYVDSQDSIAAQREFHDFLLQHLLATKELGYSRKGEQLFHEQEKLSWSIGPKNLWRASLWVPEDFCLLEKKENEYVMTAASVYSPSNWVLSEKINQTIDFIHGPVPGYGRVLSERVNRFLAGLKTNRVLLRYNWSIQPGNELLWRDDLSSSPASVDIDDASLYWRIERQSFIRLPQSEAIVFGIRIFLHSFDELRKIEDFNHSIEQLIRQLPDDQKHYKGLLS